MKFQKKKAVALEYGAQESPTLIAKGQDDLALEIIEEAKNMGFLSLRIRSSFLLCRRLAYPRKFQKSCIMRLQSCLPGRTGSRVSRQQSNEDVGLFLISCWMVLRFHRNERPCVRWKLLCL